jgi:LysR family hydrogen peroxide-inducible transcriptional activator
VPCQADHQAAIVAPVGRPPVLAVGHQRATCGFLERFEVELLHLFAVVKSAHRVGLGVVLVQNVEVQGVRPPSVDELRDAARASRGDLVGRLRIGIIPTVAPYLLPRVIANLARMHPELDIHVRETVTPTLLRELDEGAIDTAIVALPVSEAGLTEVPLFEEPFLLVRPGSEAKVPAPDAEHLREMRVLLLEEGHCFRDQALSFCKMQSGPPREVLDASSLSTLVQMVGAGIGVTLIPEMAVEIETRSADVTITRFSPPEPARTIGMAWRRTSPLAEQLSAIASDVFDGGR